MSIETRKPNAPADWREKFLTALAAVPNVSGAARLAGVDRSHAYAARRAEPEFAEAWDVAIEDALDALEGKVYQKAFAMDDHTSAFLALNMLKAHRPGKYRDKIPDGYVHVSEAPDARRIVIQFDDPAPPEWLKTASPETQASFGYDPRSPGDYGKNPGDRRWDDLSAEEAADVYRQAIRGDVEFGN